VEDRVGAAAEAPTFDDAEILRRVAHVLVGLLAYVAPYVGFEIALFGSLFAFVANFFFLDRLPYLSKVGRVARGSRGVWAFPLTIALLLVVFRERLWIAQAGWLAVGLGDGTTPLFARFLRGGPRWPTRPEKRLLPSLFGGVVAAAAIAPIAPSFGVACASAACGLLAEALPRRIDDNFGWPIFAAAGAWFFSGGA
jgi:dolichol kinase